MKRLEIKNYVVTQNDYNYDVIIYRDKSTVFRSHYGYPLSEKQLRDLFDNFIKDFESENTPKIKWISEENKINPDDLSEEKLINIFNQSSALLFEESGFAMLGIDNKYHIDTSSILTILIQYVGRYCENHASDLFIEWTENIETTIKKVSKNDSEKLLVFAIRKNGVDPKELLLGNKFGPYRQILALNVKKIHTSPDNRTMQMIMTLKNITENINNCA